MLCLSMKSAASLRYNQPWNLLSLSSALFLPSSGSQDPKVPRLRSLHVPVVTDTAQVEKGGKHR